MLDDSSFVASTSFVDDVTIAREGIISICSNKVINVMIPYILPILVVDATISCILVVVVIKVIVVVDEIMICVAIIVGGVLVTVDIGCDTLLLKMTGHILSSPLTISCRSVPV